MNYLAVVFLSVCSVFSVYGARGSYGNRKNYMPMVKVELDVFSGNQNPWINMPMPFMMSMMQKFPPKPMNNGNNMRDLGYRGFIMSDGSQSMRIPRGSSMMLEGMMMNFFNVPMQVRQHCNRQIFGNQMNNAMYTEMTRSCQNPQSSFVYQPEMWNSNPTVQSNNNCYNYVNDIMTNTFAQPGRANGYTPPSTTGPNMQYGTELDGMVRIEPTSPNCLPIPNGGNLAALVIWPDTDYHFYRLDNDGTFSHKPGQTAARNVDNSGEMIRDPRIADRGPYSVFHCFLETNSNNVNIM